jgi:hypothetical protein
LNPVAVMEHLAGRWAGTLSGKQMLHIFVDDIGGPIYRRYAAFFQRNSRVAEPPLKGILRISGP